MKLDNVAPLVSYPPRANFTALVIFCKNVSFLAVTDIGTVNYVTDQTGVRKLKMLTNADKGG